MKTLRPIHLILFSIISIPQTNYFCKKFCAHNKFKNLGEEQSIAVPFYAISLHSVPVNLPKIYLFDNFVAQNKIFFCFTTLQTATLGV